MAVTNPRMRDGLYLGRLTDAQISAILDTVGRTEEQRPKVIPVFKKKLFNFPQELILRAADENTSIRRIIHNEGLDYRQWQGELRDDQTIGTAFMYLSPRSILGDGVGSGKTAETAALLNVLKQNGWLTRALICCEINAIGQMLYEMAKFTGMRVVEMPTQAADMRKAIQSIDWSTVDIVVMGHSGLRSDVFSTWLAEYLDENGQSKIFNTFILDESSVIKSSGTQIYDYTCNICNIVPRVHFLNATAFETSIMDIYNQMDMIEPDAMPKAWRIEREYRTWETISFWKTNKQTHKPQMEFRRKPVGYKNQDKFKNALKLLYFGRPRAVGANTYRVVEVDPTPTQQLWIGRKERYDIVLNCPSLIPDMKMETSCENVPKLQKLVEMLSGEYAGKNVMIYCFHIEAQRAIKEELEKAGRKPVVLNGETAQKERFDIQSKFNSGEYDVLVTNIQRSLNLQGGEVCIIYSQVGNPARMEQVRGRIDRDINGPAKEFVLMLYKGTAEYNFFLETAAQRAKDARDLTIDAKTAVDFFMESLEQEVGNND